MLPKHFPLKQGLHAAKTFLLQTEAACCQNISPSNKGYTFLKHLPLEQRLHAAETFPSQTKATHSQNISLSNKGHMFLVSKMGPLCVPKMY